ncbi:MAG TPA: hypothetical protein VLJ59_03350, partial [Mycobacteriales bacterium]|nr:hypothetical protein [Mycobacteriales bacterium]
MPAEVLTFILTPGLLWALAVLLSEVSHVFCRALGLAGGFVGGSVYSSSMSDVVASVVEQLSVLLGSCRDACLWGLSDAQVDELLVRVHQQLGQVTGTLLLP